MSDQKTIVVKIGSSLLVDEENGKLRMDFLHHLLNDVAYFRNKHYNVVLVSSGSVALGRRFTSVAAGEAPTLAQKQAAAAQGQPLLIATYQRFAREHELRTAQVLITSRDLEERRRFLNAEDTLEELLNQGAVPIVNENDTVATQHLRVGDNDRLSAKIAHLVEADDLIILTNVAGLLDKDGQVIETVDELTEDIFALASGPSGPGTGGMVTKLKAAEIAAAAGCNTHITSGHGTSPIRDALEHGTLHTTIRSETTPESARHLWIATSLDIQGQLSISKQGAEQLKQGKSLFPSDILEIKEGFSRGDIVSIRCEGEEFARGIVSFYDFEVNAIKGHPNETIDEILGYKRRPDVIHMNDIAILETRFVTG